MKLEFLRRIFEEWSNTNFHVNLSICCRIVLCGRTDGQTDMTKPIVTFCNFAKAPKKEKILYKLYIFTSRNTEISEVRLYT